MLLPTELQAHILYIIQQYQILSIEKRISIPSPYPRLLRHSCINLSMSWCPSSPAPTFMFIENFLSFFFKLFWCHYFGHFNTPFSRNNLKMDHQAHKQSMVYHLLFLLRLSNSSSLKSANPNLLGTLIPKALGVKKLHFSHIGFMQWGCIQIFSIKGCILTPCSFPIV